MKFVDKVLPVIISMLLMPISGYSLDRSYQKNAEYVGSASCKECHVERYYSMMHTQHPYKLQTASQDSIIGDFDKNNTYTVKGQTTEMTRKGEQFFIKTLHSGSKVETYPIKYVIGQFWKQRYITVMPNGALHILPVQWNVETQEWVDYHGLKKRKPGSGSYWSDPQRTYQIKCMGCHTTGSSYSYDTKKDQYVDTKWADVGVTCEGCHGPGSLHVNVSLKQKKDTIFNPGTYPDSKRAAMVCGSCHNRGKSTDGKHGYPTRGIAKNGNIVSPIHYLPGDNIYFLYDEKPGVHSDGSPLKHHQQFNDWVVSGHNDAGVACWDCHNSHTPGLSNKSQLKLPGSVLCVSCHQVQSKGVHSLHSTSGCIGCHMPKTAKNAVPNDIAAHHMRVLQPQQTIDDSKAPNSCTLCHYHKDHELSKLQKAFNDAKGYSLSTYK